MAVEESDTTTCPYCAETVKKAARVCKHCQRALDSPQTAGVPSAQVIAVQGQGSYNKENSTGLWAMIFGIFGLVVPCLVFPAVIAIAGGFAGKGKCDRGQANNIGQCTAAIVTGFIGIALSVVAYGVAILSLYSSA